MTKAIAIISAQKHAPLQEIVILNMAPVIQREYMVESL